MPTLTLDRVAPGKYSLGQLGTLHNERRYAAVIGAGGEAWRLRRKAFGFGQAIVARDTVNGSQKVSYVPRGFLHLRGIFGGELKVSARSLDWRANHQLGRKFTLTEGGELIASFEAVSAATPARLEIADLDRLAPLELLLCCHLVKQVIDTAAAGGTPGAVGAAPGGASHM